MVKRPRLTLAALTLLIVGPLLALGTHLPLATATGGRIALYPTNLALLAVFLPWAASACASSCARVYAS